MTGNSGPMTDLEDELYGLRCVNDRLQRENAKLRELVREMYAAMDMADYVHEFDDPMHLMFVDDLTELGIEVDK